MVSVELDTVRFTLKRVVSGRVVVLVRVHQRHTVRSTHIHASATLVFAKLNTIIINFPDLDQTHLTSFDAAAESGLKFCLRFLFIFLN